MWIYKIYKSVAAKHPGEHIPLISYIKEIICRNSRSLNCSDHNKACPIQIKSMCFPCQCTHCGRAVCMCINHAKLRAIVHCNSSQTLIHPLYLNTHIHKTHSQSRLQWFSFPFCAHPIKLLSVMSTLCVRACVCVRGSSFGFLLNSHRSPTLELFNLSDGEKEDEKARADRSRGWEAATMTTHEIWAADICVSLVLSVPLNLPLCCFFDSHPANIPQAFIS